MTSRVTFAIRTQEDAFVPRSRRDRDVRAAPLDLGTMILTKDAKFVQRFSQNLGNLSNIFFQSCNCHPGGSVSQQCDKLSGLCRCLLGFEGDRCDRCSPGYYNFPKCRPCNCHPGGTVQEKCDENGNCECDRNGICECKEYAEGKKLT